MKRAIHTPISHLNLRSHMVARHALAGALLGTTALVSVPVAIAQETGAPPTPHLQASTRLTTVDANITRAQPMLNAGLAHGGFHALPGEPVIFRTYWNYDSSINWAAIRIFRSDDIHMDEPVAVIAISKDAPTMWTPDAGDQGDYFYVLRAYDTEGKYDETRPRPLKLSQQDTAAGGLAPSPHARSLC